MMKADSGTTIGRGLSDWGHWHPQRFPNHPTEAVPNADVACGTRRVCKAQTRWCGAVGNCMKLPCQQQGQRQQWAPHVPSGQRPHCCHSPACSLCGPGVTGRCGSQTQLLLHHITQPPVLTTTRVAASAYCLNWMANLQRDPSRLLGTGMSSLTKAAHALPSAMEAGTGAGQAPSSLAAARWPRGHPEFCQEPARKLEVSAGSWAALSQPPARVTGARTQAKGGRSQSSSVEGHIGRSFGGGLAGCV